jgi:Trypsin-co-occurring domain 1
MLAEDDGVLVPVEVDGHAIMLSVPPDGLGGPRPDECKQDIVARPPSLHAALDALAAVSRELGSRLQDTGTCKVSIEFGGGEFAGESGGFVEVIGKASARSAFKVGLGWTKP